jgi:hypothetical protein
MSSLPLGNSSDIAGFSPADFQDADDTRPLEIQMDITGTGTLLPYSTLVNNALSRTLVEIKDKTTTPSPTPANWRRRLREFMQLKNEDLVTFLKKPLASSSALSRAEVFVQKFGRSDFTPTHQSLQYAFLDISGSSDVEKIEHELKGVGPASPKEILEEVRWLYDMYRVAGDDCLTKEAALKLRLDILDKTYQKIIGFCELPINQDSEKVAEAIEAYVKKLYEDNNIEEDYKKTIEAYRRFAALKEIIQLLRFTDVQDREPLCSICLAESVGFVVVPCGHTFCGTCLKRQTSACYMCRSHIKDRVKVFFG